MTDADGHRIEAAEQFGFSPLCSTDPVYRCTEAQLIAFAKAAERKGRAEAITLVTQEGRVTDFGAQMALKGVADELLAMNAASDAELAPILANEEERYMTSRGYVRGTEEPGKRWVRPEESEEVPQVSDNECCDLAAVEPCPDCPTAQKFCPCGACVELCPGPDGKPLCEESDKTTQISDCEVCGGDCAAANPPVINCPNQRLV